MIMEIIIIKEAQAQTKIQTPTNTYMLQNAIQCTSPYIHIIP